MNTYRDYLVFAHKASADFEVYVADCLDKFSAAKRSVESVKVPGRTGNLTISDGTYENLPVRYRLYVKGDILERIRAFRNFLNINPGYQRLEDSFSSDEYRMAQFSSLFEVQASDRKNASFEIEFDCMPQRFLKNGENVITLTVSGQILNPHMTTSTPTVRVYGTGTVTIGGIPITVNTANVYTDIDCDAQSAYKGTADCNGNITLQGGKFWTIKPGYNTITLGSGISKVEITPHYWIL